MLHIGKKHIAAVAVLMIVTMLFLSSCSLVNNMKFETYADSGKYTVGSTVINGNVENIDIHWNSGDLKILFAPGSSTEVSEKNSPADDRYKVRSYLDGTTLRIRFAESGAPALSGTSLRKELTVVLPEGVKFGDFTVITASGAVECVGILADNLTVTTGSGKVTFEGTASSLAMVSGSGNLAFSGKVGGKLSAVSGSGNIYITSEAASAEIVSSSGDINFAQLGESDKISLTTSSGRIMASSEKSDTTKIETLSGSVEYRAGETDSIKAESKSGSVHIGFSAPPTEIDVESLSGNITLSMPSDTGFKASVSKGSGSFSSDFPVKDSNGKLVSGNEKTIIKIATGSGRVILKTDW